jgi:hypothetical protein
MEQRGVVCIFGRKAGEPSFSLWIWLQFSEELGSKLKSRQFRLGCQSDLAENYTFEMSQQNSLRK